MKSLWVGLAALPPIFVFAFATFAIGAHLAAPETPAPNPGVYIAALASLAVLGSILFVLERVKTRRLKQQTVRAARRQINSP
ncbi:hypothetical protein D2E76_16230 [Mycobacteroides abscessus]|uniref:Transmembrane protein n=1 Tax=Mycobacteroides abscessus TaxID=36809 RepID=A0ABD7HLX9_9MYCO|nr:hypothetical protein [Mycobacteroides abscessus]RIT36799.1 hypothetical protein D2E76_16230 [Mycobacteroides abscessus]